MKVFITTGSFRACCYCIWKWEKRGVS